MGLRCFCCPCATAAAPIPATLNATNHVRARILTSQKVTRILCRHGRPPPPGFGRVGASSTLARIGSQSPVFFTAVISTGIGAAGV